MSKQTITLPQESTPLSAPFTDYREKFECVAYTTGVVITKDRELTDALNVTWYKARSGDGASPVYCMFWLHGAKGHFRGQGVVRGGGYDKRHAAFESALERAGFKLDHAPQDTRQLCEALLRAAGWTSKIGVF